MKELKEAVLSAAYLAGTLGLAYLVSTVTGGGAL